MAEFAHLFGLHPWDIDRLTVEQFRDYQRYADERRRQMEQAARKT